MPKFTPEPRRSGRERKLKHSSMDVNAIINSPHFDYIMSEAQRRLEQSGGGSGSRETRSSRRLAQVGALHSPINTDSNHQHHPTSSLLETDGEEEIHITRSEKRLTRNRRSHPSPPPKPTPSLTNGEDESSRDIVYGEEDRRASLRSRSRLPLPHHSAPAADASADRSSSSPDSDSGEEEEEEEPMGRRQSSRQHRQPDRFAVADPRDSLASAKRDSFGERGRRERDATPPRSHRANRHRPAFLSPAHRRRQIRGRMTSGRSHDRRSSSTSSDDSAPDIDDARFERRKAKSLARAREKFLPSNMDPKDARQGLLRDRVRAVGASCTDVDPMELDRSIKFDQVGGLSHHIQALKEMIIFPMVYPEVFEKFKLAPPRGVIFYGPPGTGKTLVARALSNECSKGDKKVSFFMRKGADCLSKWVGESERQLRLLFEQAYTMRPSIIFFDELDGIAPVRSSRQDQIHSSIVSTLLALMDGLDARGEIVVIGATNRLDALDPALRRPGRFDRELRFSLPDRTARREILSLATKDWSPPLQAQTLDWVAEQSVGYCGADLKGVCTEAALVSLRQSFPQIYVAEEKLRLDLAKIRVRCEDFEVAMRNLRPASRRNLELQTRSIPEALRPLLSPVLKELMEGGCIPSGYLSHSQSQSTTSPSSSTGQRSEEQSYAQVLATLERRKAVKAARLLIAGPSGEFGQTSHVAPALLHAMDHLEIHSLAIPAVYASSSARSPEESVAEILRSAARAAATAPVLLFLPAIEDWHRVVPASVWYTLTAALESWDALTSIFLLVTAHEPLSQLHPDICHLFRPSERREMSLPTEAERRTFFARVFLVEAGKEPSRETNTTYPVLPVVPRATEEDKLRSLSQAEAKVLRRIEEGTLRELRSFLRDVLSRLLRDRRFAIFSKPVDPEEAPDYAQIISQPMDLGRMMEKIDLYAYQSAEDFLSDIDLIAANALEYNPDNELFHRSIRHRACALRDAAYAIIEEDLDPEFERRLNEVVESMRRRGAEAPQPPSFLLANMAARPQSSSFPHRYSTRSHGPVLSPKPEEEATEAREEVQGGDPGSSQSNSSSQPQEERAQRKRVLRARANPKDCLPKRRRKHHPSADARTVLNRHSKSILRKYRGLKRAGLNAPPSSATPHSNASSKTPTPSSLPSQDTEEEVEEEVEEKPRVLRIDEDELNRLLDEAVAKTRDWSLLHLERLYADLSAEVERWVDGWDRAGLPPALAEIIRQASSQ